MIQKYLRRVVWAAVGVGVVSGMLFFASPTAHAGGEKNLRVVKLEDGKTLQLRLDHCGQKMSDETDGDSTNNTLEEQCESKSYNIESGKTVELHIGYKKKSMTPCNYNVRFDVGAETVKMDILERTSGNYNGGQGCADEGPGDKEFDIIAEADDTGETDSGVVGEEEESASNCQIDGIGWIICPVFYFLGALVDGAQAGVVKLLESQPLNVNISGENPTYEAWKTMRNIGNVAFVIAFLLIIFSQLTNVGISNYGVKKLLPRLVIAAILVNVSYWICAIAVDLTNILGYSIKEQMQGLADDMGSVEDNGVFGGGTGDGLFLTIVGGALAGTLVAANLQFVLLSIIVPLLITATAAIVTVVVVLTIRQALIIVLIVVSPLAFVAFLLPNTENLFNKWKGLFTTLLLMFPVVSLIFGVSAFASKVIMYGTDDKLVQVVGAFVAIIPLFVTPVLMKTAGGLLNRVAGVVNNTDKGAFDRLRNINTNAKNAAAAQRRGNNLNRAGNILKAEGGGLGKTGSRRRRAYAAIRSSGASVRADTAKKQAFMEAAAKEEEEEYIAGRAVTEKDKFDNNGNLKKAGYARRVAGEEKAEGFRASAQSAVNKIEQQDVQSRTILMEEENDPRELVKEAANSFEFALANDDLVGAMASQTILLNTGSKGLEKLQDAYENIQENPNSKAYKNFESTDQGSIGGALRNSLNKAGIKGKNNALAVLAHSGGNIRDLKSADGVYGGLSATELAGQSRSNIFLAAEAGSITAKQASDTLNNPNAALSPDKRLILESVASGKSLPENLRPKPKKADGAPESEQQRPQQQQQQQQRQTPAVPQAQTQQPQTQQPVSQPQSNYQPRANPQPQGYANASQAPQGPQQSPQQQTQQPQQQQQNQQQAPASSQPQPQAQTFSTANTNTSNQQANYTTVNQTIRNEYDTKIAQAGGVQQMSQQDLVGLINKTQNVSGLQGEHDKLRTEFGRRRGSDIPSQPYDPKNPPTPPPTY